ncbi:polyprenyl synthetase family protein [Isoptericola variabilis]|uniref:Polyprenyl synthetase n=1 Tax=Isoptericola variabilis (strain 225) TaxID=743718 RepID=F6FWI2_ISOV2|nr:polyprenyl synthetase family protein [Isoptericola variabilis]AEG44556.1 Polyprenyl synthetase [Isoptericola variabilis 225]TWH26527.1 geranylgeranyl diphosphate synthase type I [Isoptericola variabilis J7]
MPSPASLVDLENLRHDVDEALGRHLDRLAQEVAGVGGSARALTDELAALLQGGKRLRAAFCYWSYRAHGGTGEPGPVRDAAVRAGAALELFQAAALLHDDVMDASDTRRGRPTAHRAFEARHSQAGWAGRADRFGASAAILLGDLCLVACQRELGEALEPLPTPTVRAARELFDAMQSEVIVGQYLDVLVQAEPWGVDPAADEDRARTVIRAKSARYSVERPLALGAVLAGAPADRLDAIGAAGLPLGEAFQLRDDVLGVFGDPAVTGKPAGDDLREGKRTVLMARTMAGADDAERALVATRLGDPALDDHAVDALRAAIVRTGALEGVEELIDALARRALDTLAAADLAEPGRTVLAELARAAVDRAF